MSNIINKVKDVLHKDHTSTSTTGTTGTHSTGAHTTGTTGTHTGTTGTHTGVTGSHNNGLTGNNYSSSGTSEGVAEPHSSRIANAADPRVDSDRDGSARVGGPTTTSGFTGAHVPGSTSHSDTSEGVSGPHSSRIANAADPRVDSDRDGSRNAGAATGTSGYTGTHTGAGTHSGSSIPPHSSSLLNKLDPRVDTSSATGSTTHTTGTHSTGGATRVPGTSGGISSSTNAGPHDSNIANKVDPRVDSDLDGRGNRTGASKAGILGVSGSHATPGSGTTQNTAGPHNSDILNKVDPRVDSDLSGGGVGGSRTYQ